jgi:hypothetical protein
MANISKVKLFPTKMSNGLMNYYLKNCFRYIMSTATYTETFKIKLCHTKQSTDLNIVI